MEKSDVSFRKCVSKGWALSPHCAKGNREPQAELDSGYVSVRADRHTPPQERRIISVNVEGLAQGYNHQRCVSEGG